MALSRSVHKPLNSYSDGFLIAVLYHSFFGYPLSGEQTYLWSSGLRLSSKDRSVLLDRVFERGGYYFLDDLGEKLKIRRERERNTKHKLKIADKASYLLSFFPQVLFVGISGSLAMENASKDADVDLFVIVSKNTLWLTRLLAIVSFYFFGLPVRRSWSKDEKNKLCLNMWVDERDVTFPLADRNIYLAHEICQIKPLFERNGMYARFIECNGWVFRYWPKMKKVIYSHKFASRRRSVYLNPLILSMRFVEPFFYKSQNYYMRRKITRETVSHTKAFFHPFDWSDKISNFLIDYGVFKVKTS